MGKSVKEKQMRKGNQKIFYLVFLLTLNTVYNFDTYIHNCKLYSDCFSFYRLTCNNGL